MSTQQAAGPPAAGIAGNWQNAGSPAEAGNEVDETGWENLDEDTRAYYRMLKANGYIRRVDDTTDRQALIQQGVRYVQHPDGRIERLQI